ncbi:OTU domain-containing protein 5-B isoform X1 [Anopheles merus]|uniref:OTU domain-containing protein 5-B isoform X1 n=1 Tax=Anopheles merus TaxID=30066 RepID=UPI001BE47F5A|nr:OTU domain-containing protein 5-B isoform X1 [Anopheles merus]
MTIKPVVNQKSAKEETQEGTPQNVHGVGNAGVRTSHRNVVLNQLSSSESQALPREKRVLTPHSFDSDSVVRHRRSPHKNLGRLKRDHYHKRESREREKATGSPSYHHHVVLQPSASGKKQSTACSSTLASAAGGGRSPKSTHQSAGAGGSLLNSHQAVVGSPGASGVDLNAVLEEVRSGYNSGDEYIDSKDAQLTADEWKKRDEAFAKVLSERGFILHEMEEDGACLFRAISLQIYGDQEMHEAIRQQTMDYIYQNREYFAQFVTEDIADYVERKRANHVHGNHIEIQAMSEMYNRSVELYCYQTEPTNIFNSDQINNGNEPFRLSYQRSSHYNAIVNPYKASVGVGLGLAGYRPDELDIKQVADAVRMSEELEIEKTMLEDKLKTTDWEATNEEIEEQIARESYAQYCREARLGAGGGSSQNKSTSSTITSTEMMAACASGSQSASSYLLELRKSPPSAGHGNQQQAPISSGMGSDRGACSSSSKNSSFELDCCSSSPSSSQQHYYYGSGASSNGNGTGSNNNSTSCSSECNRRKKRNINSPFQLNLPNRIEKTNSAETKKCKANGNRTSSTSSNSPRRSESPAEEKSPTPSPPSTSSTMPPPARDGTEEESSSSGSGGAGAGGVGASVLFPSSLPPSTGAARDETPMSEFYQSLLESSYTDDGSFGQLSEREMIQKALEESAMDFVKRGDNSKAFQEDKYGTTDEEYDSPSP